MEHEEEAEQSALAKWFLALGDEGVRDLPAQISLIASPASLTAWIRGKDSVAWEERWTKRLEACKVLVHSEGTCALFGLPNLGAAGGPNGYWSVRRVSGGRVATRLRAQDTSGANSHLLYHMKMLTARMLVPLIYAVRERPDADADEKTLHLDDAPAPLPSPHPPLWHLEVLHALAWEPLPRGQDGTALLLAALEYITWLRKPAREREEHLEKDMWDEPVVLGELARLALSGLAFPPTKIPEYLRGGTRYAIWLVSSAEAGRRCQGIWPTTAQSPTMVLLPLLHANHWTLLVHTNLEPQVLWHYDSLGESSTMHSGVVRRLLPSGWQLRRPTFPPGTTQTRLECGRYVVALGHWYLAMAVAGTTPLLHPNLESVRSTLLPVHWGSAQDWWDLDGPTRETQVLQWLRLVHSG